MIIDKSFRLMRLVRKANALRAPVLVRRALDDLYRQLAKRARPPDGADVRDRHGGMARIAQDHRRHLQSRAGRADRAGHGPDQGPRGRIAGDATSPGSARSPRPPRSSGCSGTVWGIMNSFQAIAATKNSTLAVVAPGIAEALFATALGPDRGDPGADRLQQAVGLDRQLRQPAVQLLRGVRGGAVARARPGQGGLSAWPSPLQAGKAAARPPRPPAQARDHGRDQHDAAGRRHAGAADRVHDHGTAARPRASRSTCRRRTSAPLPGQDEPLSVIDRRRGRGVHPGQRRSRWTSSARGCRRSPAASPDARIFVRGDRGIDYGTVMGVVSAINQAGFGKVALLTVPGRAAAAP